MLRDRGIGVALLVLALPLASCSTYHLRAYAGYMRPVLSGNVGLSNSGGASANVDAKDGLGLSEASSPYGRVDAGLSVLNLTASGFRYDDRGDGTLEAAFGGINAGVPVHSDAQMLVLKGAASFTLVDLGFLRLSPGFAVDYMDLNLDVTSRSPAPPATESLDVNAPVPMPFVQGEVELGPVAATLDVGGIAIDIDQVNGTYLDIEGLVRVQPIDHLEVFAGYRWIQFDAKGTAGGQDYDADVTMQGVIVGAGVTF